jgi:CDP-alcohol phosphatidyltransferase
MQQPKEKVTFESTLKSSDTEEVIDIYFYRPIGFYLALFFRAVGITPNPVTIASIFIGMAGGYLFYYENLSINITGMLLLMFANSLDSADGQLARMTNNKSRVGRVLDGLAGSFWFIVIHVALCLRLENQGFSSLIWLLGLGAILSHMIQAQQADYYRNVHLYFIKGESGSEFDHSKDLNEQFAKVSWGKNFGQKLFLGFYRNYTKQQELLSPNLQKLMGLIRERYSNKLPDWLVTEFRAMNKPLMKYTNIVQFNTRTLFLFFCLFINKLWLYFLFDMIVLTSIMLYMIWRQEKVSKHFYQKLLANPAL